MTDDWLKEIDKEIVGAVLLHFSVAFDIQPVTYCGFRAI
jgi:hypothetical protein